MPINANIFDTTPYQPGSIVQPTLLDPMAAKREVLQTKALGQQQELQALQLQQGQSAAALQQKRQEAFKGAVSQGEDGKPVIDYPAIFKNMAAYGDPDLPKFYESWAAQEAARVKAARDATKDTYEIQEKARTAAANLASQINPADPQSAARVIAALNNDPNTRQLVPANIEDIVRDPRQFETWRRSLLTSTQQEGIAAREDSALDRKERYDATAAATAQYRRDRLADSKSAADTAKANREFMDIDKAVGRFNNSYEKLGQTSLAADALGARVMNIDLKTGRYKGGMSAEEQRANDSAFRNEYAKYVDPGATVQANDIANQMLGTSSVQEARELLNKWFNKDGSMLPEFRKVMANRLLTMHNSVTKELEANRAAAKRALKQAHPDIQEYGMLDTLWAPSEAWGPKDGGAGGSVKEPTTQEIDELGALYPNMPRAQRRQLLIDNP